MLCVLHVFNNTMLCHSKVQHFVALFFQSSNSLFITEKKHSVYDTNTSSQIQGEPKTCNATIQHKKTWISSKCSEHSRTMLPYLHSCQIFFTNKLSLIRPKISSSSTE